jgi:cytochrome c oxidase subunit I
VLNGFFMVSSMVIAVPTGVKIFNWLATIWRGHIRLTTPFLFSVGFVALFIIGGLSGVTHALVPSDYQQTDTYYVVAHFHYVLFGGAIFGLFSGVYYWWPKIFGRMLNEGLGKLHFWLMFVGANLTFGPMHIVGLQGQPRRTYTYPEGMGWDTYNFMETIGGFIIALSILVFLVNAVRSRTRGERAGNDPWDGRTLEWSISSPPPEHNFDEIPVVHSLDDFWHRKYVEDRGGRLVRVPSGAQENTPGDGERSDEEEKKVLAHQETVHKADVHAETAVHMPSPSYMPLLAALGMPIIAYGVVYRWWGMLLGGALVVITGLYGWVFEPGTE